MKKHLIVGILLLGNLVPFVLAPVILAIEFVPDSSMSYSSANNRTVQVQDTLFSIAGSTEETTNRVQSSKVEPGVSLIWQSNNAVLPKKLFWLETITKGELIYTLGGNEYVDGISNSSDSIYFARPVDGVITAWEIAGTLPWRISNGSAFARGTNMYYSGGYGWENNSAGLATREIAYATISPEGLLGIWDYAGELPLDLLGHALIPVNDRLYLIGGYSSSLATAVSSIYEAIFDGNGAITGWKGPLENTFPDSDYKPYNFMHAIVNGKLVIAGGRGPRLHDSNTYDQVFYADILPDGSLGTWQKSEHNLPRKTCCAGMAALNDQLYITGGHDGANYYDTVWVATVSNATPTPTTAPPPTPTVTPLPTPTGLPPLVLIPGAMASWSEKGLFGSGEPDNTKWKIPGFVTDYESIEQELIDVGYVKNHNLFIYAYDWRKSVTQNGESLRQFVNETVLTKNPGHSSINIVAHSMGGLVGVSAADTGFVPKIAKMVTVGTPHTGTAEVYRAWEGADLSGFSGYSGVILRAYLFANAAKYGSRIDAVRSIAPSLQDLLPTFGYLKYNSGIIVDPSQMIWKSLSAPILGSNREQIKDRLYTVSGDNKKTLNLFTIRKQNSSEKKDRLWDDGRPLKEAYTLQGDGSVVRQSSSIATADKAVIVPDQDHGEVIRNPTGIREIFKILGLPAPVFVPERYKRFDRSVVAIMASPVSFTITTPSGVTEYPFENVLVIPEAGEGKYKVNLEATGVGEYHLYLGRVYGEDEAWEMITGKVSSIGQKIVMERDIRWGDKNLGSDPGKLIRDQLERLRKLFDESKETLLTKKSVRAWLDAMVKIIDGLGKLYLYGNLKLPLINAFANYQEYLYQQVETNNINIRDQDLRTNLMQTLNLVRFYLEELRAN